MIADLNCLENCPNLKVNNNCMQTYLAVQQELHLEKVSVLFSLNDLEFYLHLRNPNEFWHLFQASLIDK